MKKVFLLGLAALAFFSCQNDDKVDVGNNEESVVNIKINVGNIKTRAVETGHSGADNAKIYPKVYSVTVMAYNDYGNVTQIDLSNAEIRQAIAGTDITLPDSKPAAATVSGAMIGLPVGTTRVDVVLNNPSNKYTDVSANINYYNYRSDKRPAAGTGDNYLGDNNFDRTFLVTENYGKGYALSDMPKNGDVGGVPSYSTTFEVSPALARFETYGGINADEEKIWIDKWGVTWKYVMTTDAASCFTKDQLDDMGIKEGSLGLNYGMKDGNKTGQKGTYLEAYYIPQYYWYPTNQKPTKTIAESTNIPEQSSIPSGYTGWVKQKTEYWATINVLYAKNVTWLPNAFYAIDVEEIFVNDILVRGAAPAYKPFLLPWPGSGSDKGWPHWYKAYHLDGWHTAGASADNSFLCMGNMWDRIAASDKTITINWADAGLSIPGVDGSSSLGMTVLTGKAKAVANVSKFYSSSPDRNLGIADGKAAAYQIYQQSSVASDSSALISELPHLILKVKCYNSAADYTAGNYVKDKEFITVKLFKTAAGFVKDFKNGNIYRVNLDDLRGSFVGPIPVPDGETTIDPIDPVDPDPEMPGAQLTMTIKVMPWTIQNIIPAI